MCTRVLTLTALVIGVAHGFNWDVVVGKQKGLEFYKNGNLTHSEQIPSANHINSVTYDPVHYRVLFVDHKNPNIFISSFDLLTKKIEHLVTTSYKDGYPVGIAYDPVTASLFWKENTNIHSLSLHHACSKKKDDGTKLLSSNGYCRDVVVESCGGYIYWNADHNIERARFDGSERKVLIDRKNGYLRSLAIDQQTQRMYWIEMNDAEVSIESADFNGKNRMTLYFIQNETDPGSLAISKDFIYWRGTNQKAMWQLPKNPRQHVAAKLITKFDTVFGSYQIVAANYAIAEQTQGHENCESLKSLLPNTPDESLFCIHGTKVSGESRCECAQGYTGERCDVYICQNYCLQGDCSVSAEGQPKCRCNAGYSGERCEVNACHKHCLHNAHCSLNEEDEPVCECSADYEGERCDFATTQNSVQTDKTNKELLRNLRVFSYKHDEYEFKV